MYKTWIVESFSEWSFGLFIKEIFLHFLPAHFSKIVFSCKSTCLSRYKTGTLQIRGPTVQATWNCGTFGVKPRASHLREEMGPDQPSSMLFICVLSHQYK